MLARTLGLIYNHPANRTRRIRALAVYVLWQTNKRLLGKPWDVDYHGLKLRIHPDSHSASAALYFNGLPDYSEMLFMRHYLRGGDNFLDIGANVGVYSIFAASLVGPTGRVHAFEPNPAVTEHLRENIRLNAAFNIVHHCLALSDQCSEMRLSTDGEDCTAHLSVDSQSLTGGVKINCVTLDSYIPDEQFAMAKLDIEGAEPLAIRGAYHHLQKSNPPVLQIEMDGYSRRYGIATEQFISELHDLNYDTGVYDAESRKINYTRTPWRMGAVNVLAVNRDRRLFVEERIACRRGAE